MGIKVWVLSDSINGYVKKLQLYGNSDSESGGIGLCSRVVLHLVKGLENTELHCILTIIIQVQRYSTTYTLVASIPVEEYVTITGTTPKIWSPKLPQVMRFF